MKKKLLGIFVCTLLIATALPAVGTMTVQDNNSSNQNIGGRGGMFRQLPSPPVGPMPYAWISDSQMGWQVYEDFWEVSSPICDIHWWGVAVIRMNDTWYQGNPEGMTFDIIFFEDEDGEPGAEVCSYTEVSPLIIGTGIMYDYPDESEGPFELYYFEADLNPCCNLSNGWVSIIKKDSPTDSMFGWHDSPDGNDKMYQNTIQCPTDVAFILTDGEEPDLEINIKSGFGATIEITNSGDETLTGIPVDVVVYGGMLSMINVHVRETIHLDPSDTASVGTGLFLGLGKIAIGVIADDVVEYHSGLQLFIFTIVQ